MRPKTVMFSFVGGGTKAKKGVTSGMKLSQPMKKNDDLNLDLTMQIDLTDDTNL